MFFSFVRISTDCTSHHTMIQRQTATSQEETQHMKKARLIAEVKGFVINFSRKTFRKISELNRMCVHTWVKMLESIMMHDGIFDIPVILQ